MAGTTLIIRADAGPRMGNGHIMRCLALAEAWHARGGDTLFAIAEGGDVLAARLRTAGARVATITASPGSLDDAGETAAIARAEHAGCVVIDGYHFDVRYRDAVRATGKRILIVDDGGDLGPYRGDLLLNHNPYATESLYTAKQEGPLPHLLLGSPYTLIRREFLACPTPAARSGARDGRPGNGRLLVTLGGADPANVTPRVLEALALIRTRAFAVDVVVGESNPHWAELERAAAATPHAVTLHRPLRDAAATMVRADLAISAAGITSWELAFLGIPTLLIILAENQRPAAAFLARAGGAVDLGWHASIEPAALAHTVERLMDDAGTRRIMASRQHACIDGQGAARVAAAIAQLR